MGDGFSVFADKEDTDIIYWQLQGGMFARLGIDIPRSTLISCSG